MSVSVQTECGLGSLPEPGSFRSAVATHGINIVPFNWNESGCIPMTFRGQEVAVELYVDESEDGTSTVSWVSHGDETEHLTSYYLAATLAMMTDGQMSDDHSEQSWQGLAALQWVQDFETQLESRQ